MHKIKPCFCRIFKNSQSIKFRVDSNLKHSDHTMLKNITCVALLLSNVKHLLQNVFVCTLALLDGFIEGRLCVPQRFSLISLMLALLTVPTSLGQLAKFRG